MKFVKFMSVHPTGGKVTGETIIRADMIDRVWEFDGAQGSAAKTVLVIAGTQTVHVSQTVAEVFKALA